MLPSRSKSLSGQSSSSSGPKGPVLIEGMLEKKKTFGSSKFFCSLHDGKLWYSEDKGRESIIDISHAQSVREGKAKFSFEIITSSRTHAFVADSQPTRDKWIACLREVMRVSSRKNSTLSYIESANSDEETVGASSSSNPRSSSSSSVASSGQRSSGVKSPTSPLKPGFVASLPVGLTTRGTTNPPSVAAPIKEERTHPGRTTSEMTSLLESVPPSQTVESVRPKPSLEPVVVLEQEVSKGGVGNRAMSGAHTAAAAAAYDGARNEIKEDEDDRMHVTLSRDDGEYETKALSKDDDRESAALTRNVNNDENDSHNTVATEIVSMSPNSLYANNADIKKFLYEQSMEEDEEEEHRADSVRASTSEETKCERKKSDDSASERQLQTDRKDRGGAMSRGNTEEEEEEADDVFKCGEVERKDRNEEMKPPVPPVLRRASQPAVSMIVDSAQEEPASSSVELDVDFCRQPIPNLPHPHLDENWSLAFVEMRSILSSSDSIAKKENSAALTSTFIFKEQRQGCAVDSLKHFLKNIECG